MIWLEISVNKKYKPIKPTKRTIKNRCYIELYTLFAKNKIRCTWCKKCIRSVDAQENTHKLNYVIGRYEKTRSENRKNIGNTVSEFVVIFFCCKFAIK